MRVGQVSTLVNNGKQHCSAKTLCNGNTPFKNMAKTASSMEWSSSFCSGVVTCSGWVASSGGVRGAFSPGEGQCRCSRRCIWSPLHLFVRKLRPHVQTKTCFGSHCCKTGHCVAVDLLDKRRGILAARRAHISTKLSAQRLKETLVVSEPIDLGGGDRH